MRREKKPTTKNAGTKAKMKNNFPTKKLGEMKKPKVYLIGVDHIVQWNKNLQVTKNFENYLDVKIKKLNIELIAEEFSQEASERSGVEKTTTQEVANSFGIKYKLCDPDSKKRKELGIPSREEIKKKLNIRGAVFVNSEKNKKIEEEQRKYHSVRERFWLDQIKGKSPMTTLFVCGADHLESFQSLLSKSGYKAIVLSKVFNSL